MGEQVEIFRALRDHAKEQRRIHGKDCPICPTVRPKAHPTKLMPGQRCKVDGYVDLRERVED
jgi:hypothetical protein